MSEVSPAVTLIEQAVDKDVQEVAQQSETVIKEVKDAEGKVVGAIETAVSTAKDEAQQVSELVKHTIAKSIAGVITITAEEKLIVRELENKFLKAQLEITRLQNQASDVQRQFPAVIENLTKKYLVDPATHVFDAVKLEFKRK